jgi:hypothetical protein
MKGSRGSCGRMTIVYPPAMSADALTPLQRQIYWSAPAAGIERGLRRTSFGLLLLLRCEHLLREGRLRGPQARLATGQAQAARLLAVSATGARWPTRRGDVLRRAGDPLADALIERGRSDPPSAAATMLAAHDLIDEIIGWLGDGQLLGAAAPAAIDRLRVAQVLLQEHAFVDDDLAVDREPTATPVEAPTAPSSTPNAWMDED